MLASGRPALVPCTPRGSMKLIALAGDCYRANAAAIEADPEFMPDGYLRAARRFEADVAAWRNDPEDGLGDIGEDDAVVLATLASPGGRRSSPTSAGATSTSATSPLATTPPWTTSSGRRPTGSAARGTSSSTPRRG